MSRSLPTKRSLLSCLRQPPMSFISVEPQSRVFLESHSNSLLTQFDIQLEVIAGRYLAFFQERRRIEVSYISSLRKLHRETTTVDAPFDPRAEPTTTRAAWEKVRDSLERAPRSVEGKPGTLVWAVLIIGYPKGKIKQESGSRKVSRNLPRNMPTHSENTILKLQQAYLKKRHPHQYPQSTDVSQHPQDGPNKRFGNRVSTIFGGRQEDIGGLELSRSEEVSDDDCRRAVALLNTLRLKRVENLGDGYDCLAGLVFTPTVKNVLARYTDGMTTAYTKHGNLAMSTSAEVEKTVAGTDTPGLRASFDHALSFSIPLLTLYCNYRPNAYSSLIFGVPLVNLTTDQNYVPKVIRMCIEEVEKRGLNAHKIYSFGSIYDTDILQLRRRFESEKSFSFRSADNIHSVAMLLKLYLRDLPEPLFMLSLEDCRQYRQNRARYTVNDCSVLRSRIRELHPVHRASLEAVLLHLFRVAPHSDKNAMNKLVMEDLIENVHILFDERAVPSPYGSFLSPELPQSAEVGSTTRHPLSLQVVGEIPTSTRSSFSSSHSESPVERRLIPLLGLSLSQTLREGMETTTQEQVIPGARGTQAIEMLDGSSPEAASLPPTSTAEWWLPHSGLHQHTGTPTIPSSRPESVLSSASDFSLSAASLISSTEFPPSPAASLLSGTTDSPPSPVESLLSSMGTFSPTMSERF
ncbi:hypothetical protein EDB84DRAFT_1675592 [Lactarius hengduanensis]|nr:hypothetical protein EDB84DRAFT_1675592 [Lactarius hengduanensis]